MNEKFFELPEDKQLLILNSAYKVFACNTYKKAPMSEIAAEGMISKSLLFHYFKNKLELYIYLWDNAERITNDCKEKYKVYETDDFFEMLKRSLDAKCDIMEKYPYLSQFTVNAYYENNVEIKDIIQKKVQSATENSFNFILPKIRKNNIRKDIPFEDIYKEIIYASEGMTNNWYRANNIDIASFKEDYKKMIKHWETIYKGE